MSYVAHTSESCHIGNFLQHTAISLQHMSRVTCTGWRRLIGSPKLQIIFLKRAIKCRSLLRKMTCKDKGSYESSPPCISSVTTGWRRLIGCLKSQVIFRKRATNYKALLRKMTCKDKASYGSSPPCIARHVSAVIQRGS